VRRPHRRHGPGYQQAFGRDEQPSEGQENNEEPQLDEDGNPIPRAETPAAPQEEPGEEFFGLLEMHPNGYGFLRAPKNNYARERSDPFVPGTMIEKFRLRQGLKIRAVMQQSRRSQGPRIREILDVEGMKPEDYANVKSFDTLTAVNP
jgi:transcription termination factor Rho